MADNVQITSPNAARVGRELAAVRRELETDTEAGLEAAELIADEADPPVLSGFLASRITATVSSSGMAQVVADTEYASVIHYGSPARGIAARPFLTDAATRSEPLLARIFDQHAQRLLNRI